MKKPNITPNFKLGKKPNSSCSLATKEEKNIIKAIFAPKSNSDELDRLFKKFKNKQIKFTLS